MKFNFHDGKRNISFDFNFAKSSQLLREAIIECLNNNEPFRLYHPDGCFIIYIPSHLLCVTHDKEVMHFNDQSAMLAQLSFSVLGYDKIQRIERKALAGVMKYLESNLNQPSLLIP